MQVISARLQMEATLATLTEESIKSSALDEVKLDACEVRSTLAWRVGVDFENQPISKAVEGAVGLLLNATQYYSAPLTAERLFKWHASLVSHTEDRASSPGIWRNLDSEADLPAVRIPGEMNTFLTWFDTAHNLDPVLKAGLAHLWFLAIRPFEDGNGRIARAITEMALARSEDSAERYYSLSAQFAVARADYALQLEQALHGGLDVTAWLQWFLQCLGRAIATTENELQRPLQKARTWESFSEVSLNKRQRIVIQRLLDDLDGKLTSSKYATLADCSPDTALRDMKDLIAQGIFQQDAGGGRSTSYFLKPQETDPS